MTTTTHPNPEREPREPLQDAEHAAMIIDRAARADLATMREKVRAIQRLPWLRDELQQMVGCLLVLQRWAMAGRHPHRDPRSWLRQMLWTSRSGQPAGEVYANVLAVDASRDGGPEELARAQHVTLRRHVSDGELRVVIGAMAENLYREHHRAQLSRPLSGIERVRAFYGVPARRGMRVRVDGQPGRITGARRGTMQLWVRFDGDAVSRPVHPTWRVEYDPDGPI